MSSLDTYRTEFRAASNEELVKRAAPARGAAPALSPEAWLALTEEMERRGLAAPDDALADLALEEYQAAPVAAVPPPWDPLLKMVSYPRASIGRRFLAYVIDGVVGLVPLIFGMLALAAFDSGRGEGPVAATILLVIAGLAWALYYNFTKDGRPNGQSIGKKATDLMVVDVRTNKPCTRGGSALRTLVMFGLGAIPLGGLVEPLFVLIDDRGRRLGDRAANTQVIETADYRPSDTIR